MRGRWHNPSRIVISRLYSPTYIAGAALCFGATLLGLLAGINPAFALAATFAAGFALICFANLTIGVVLYMSIVFLQYGSLAKTLIASALLLVLASMAKVTTSRAAGIRMRTMFTEYRLETGLFAALLTWIALSATWAGSPNEAIVDLSRWAINIAIFFVVVTAAQNRKQLVWLLGGYVVAASFVTVFGPSVRPDFLTPAATSAEQKSLDDLRFIGGIGDPNELAALLLPGLALAIGAVGALRVSGGLRWLAVVAAVLALATLLLTASRGGLIGLFVALVVALVFAGRWRGPAAFGAMVLLVVAFTYFGVYAPEGERQRILAPTQGEGRAQESRLTLWQVATRVIEDNPVNGVGVGNYEEESVKYVLQPGETFRSDAVIDDNQPAHNTYLQVFAELGVVGFAMFSALLAFSLWSTVRAAWNFRDLGDVPMEIMSRTLLAGQAGMLTAIFFFSAQSVNKVWLVLALGPAMLCVSRVEGERVEEREPDATLATSA